MSSSTTDTRAGLDGAGRLLIALYALFADASVWSTFGAGYGFVPLVLPVLGLAWLLRAETRRAYGIAP